MMIHDVVVVIVVIMMKAIDDKIGKPLIAKTKQDIIRIPSKIKVGKNMGEFNLP